MRGDNELLLREAFHQSPKAQWNEVAGLLALSDGFRGHIERVTASDPMETIEPFTVEYEIAQPKFVDWTKKPVRIPALLPQIALPDTAGRRRGKLSWAAFGCGDAVEAAASGWDYSADASGNLGGHAIMSPLRRSTMRT